MGAHGGVKISSEDQAKAKSHLEKHYAEFEKKAPWQEDLHMKVLDLENKMASLSEELANRKPREEIFESDLASLKADIEQLKKSQEPHQEPKQEPKEPCKCVLTKEGFWARFHQLRSAGASKSEAFRLVSLEVIEAATKRPKI
jgi:hypothetical protein